MSEGPDKSTISISQRDSEEDAVFIATKFEMGTAITVAGTTDMVVDQIVVCPSDYSGELKSECGVSLNYTKTSKYHSHMGSHLVIKPEEERRLVEWLHDNDADYIIEDEEFVSEGLIEARIRGRCEECGTHFKDGVEWKVTVHQEDEHDVHFCSEECFDDWS